MVFRKKTIALFFVSLFFLFYPGVSKAIVTDTIGILPAHPDPYVRFSDSWFLYKLDPGQEKRDAVKLINNTDITSVVKLVTADGLATSDGAFALMPEDQPNRDMGTWVKLSATEVEVPPKSEKIIPFTITVPKNADVGDHMAGIAMQELETVDGNVIPTTGIKVVTRIGVRMYMTVPGEVKKGYGIVRLDHEYYPTGIRNFFKDFLDINKKTVFFVGIKNEGNVRIAPLVTLNLKNIFGRTVVNLPDQEIGTVFPRGENKDSMVVWNGMPLFGRYVAKVTVNPQLEGLSSQSREIVIWAFPSKICFMLILLAIFSILIRLIARYVVEASKERMPVYTVMTGDSLAKLSERFSVKWKKIAKLNELKKPFDINEGEKLFVPVNRKNKELIKNLLASSEMEPSIAWRSGKTGANKKKKIAFGLALVAMAGFAVYKYKTRTIHEVVQIPPVKSGEVKPKEETADKTVSGYFKKSSVKVEIAKSQGDEEAIRRLYEKFKLIGYNTSYIDKPMENKYLTTTIEFNPEKKTKAEMVKNDMRLSGNIDLKEIPNLNSDVVIYNFAGKDEYYDIRTEDEPWFVRQIP